MILLHIWKVYSEFCLLDMGPSLSRRRHLHTAWNSSLCGSDREQGLTVKLSLWFLLCMAENRLYARNSPCPVLHEIFSWTTEIFQGCNWKSYRNEIPLHKNVSHAICKEDKGTESLNARTTEKKKSFRYSEMFLSPSLSMRQYRAIVLTWMTCTNAVRNQQS